MLKWNKRDKARAQTLLRKIADSLGGWQAMADALGMEADSSRATVESWHRRGRVPLTHVHALKKVAGTNQIAVELRDLNPQAAYMEKAKA